MKTFARGDLGNDFAGMLLRPGDDGYEAARRVWNGAVDRRPALIARCLSAADIQTAVRFAREHSLSIAVRGGGHSVAGMAVCDGGLVVDCSFMKAVTVDPDARLASVSPGALWGDVDAATQVHGLAVPGGIVTHTGVAGLTLGGGIGWLMRRHGLSCDNLVGADLVTAEGQLHSASESENSDLLWGLRGGGGNFGVVTRFVFRLHRVGPVVLSGLVLHPAERAGEVLRFYREFAASLPDAATTIVTFRHVPALPLYPPELHGRPVVSIAVLHTGPTDEAERVLGPLRAFGPPLLDLIAPTPYVRHQAMFDPSVPHGLHYYWKTHYLPALSDGAIEAIAGRAWEAPSPKSYTIMFQMGGAVAQRPIGGTAFAGREAAFAVNINAVWEPPQQAEPQKQWARAVWDDLRPHASGTAYVNFLDDEGSERVRTTYGPSVYARLAALKRRYDPDNALRMNQNITPA
ncbi:MAG TPA: FAD-binding oxidoreductase [bacterium]